MTCLSRSIPAQRIISQLTQRLFKIEILRKGLSSFNEAGNEHELTAGEKIQLRRFLKEDAPAEDGDEEDDDEEEEEGGLAVAQRLHDRNQARKRARMMRTSSKYRSTKHVCSTTNMVERLFSRAKLVMTDLRGSVYPRNLEMSMFLRANRHLWDEVVVQRAILRDEA